eukprot:TRINITY_DN14437_c0_g1_i1.p1 TRINITY_DN14437_c0_g1~~TRINITY_DN14437_c0_g1_i1.p1  ORF type:complete len:246 (+),score=54.15 TRINITY_DN14437_c0_g1_i1:69-806(+)
MGRNRGGGARSRSPTAAQRLGSSLAGNVSVSLSSNGQPVATLSHPSGGSCQVLLGAARALSWKTQDGIERLAAVSVDGNAAGADAASGWLGGFGPSGTPFVAWDIETLAGGVARDDVVSVSVVSEVAAAGGAKLVARTTFSLLPSQLSVDLEISNDLEASDDDQTAVPVACGLRGHLCNPDSGDELSPPPSVEAGAAAGPALDSALGMAIRLHGFETAVTAEPATGLRERLGRWCTAFETSTSGR